jgi:putative Mn2+ efflux pump MntP
MELTNIMLIALGLAADCFAVSLSGSVSLEKVAWYRIGRVALTFGFFQGIMPVLGWLAGKTVVDAIAAFDHWLAFGLLAAIGGKMVWESFKDGDERKGDITRGLLLLTLAVATSIDALAVGLTFAFIRIDILSASLIIGAVSFCMTVIGFQLGQRAGKLLGKRAEAFGGIILIGIGVKILVEHLFG